MIKKKALRIMQFALIVLLLTPLSLAQVELIYNTDVCIADGCYAIYRLTKDSPTVITENDIKFNLWDYRDTKLIKEPDPDLTFYKSRIIQEPYDSYNIVVEEVHKVCLTPIKFSGNIATCELINKTILWSCEFKDSTSNSATCLETIYKDIIRYRDKIIWDEVGYPEIVNNLNSKSLGEPYDIKIVGNLEWGEKKDHILSFKGVDYWEYAFWNASYNYRYEINFTGNTTYGDVREIELNSSVISYSYCDGNNIVFTYYNITLGDEQRTGVDHYVWQWNETGDSFVFLKMPSNGSFFLYCNASVGSDYSTSTIFVEITNFSDTTTTNDGVYWVDCGAGSGTVSRSTNNLFPYTSDPTGYSLKLVRAAASNTKMHDFGVDYENHYLRIITNNDEAGKDIRLFSDGAPCYTDQAKVCLVKAGPASLKYGATCASTATVGTSLNQTHIIDIVSENDRRYYILDRVTQPNYDDLSGTDGALHAISIFTSEKGPERYFDEMMLFQSNFPLQTYVIGVVEAPGAGVTPTLIWNHTELNMSIGYNNFSINVSANINLTLCNLTYDGSIYSMIQMNNSYYAYNIPSSSDGNHTYYSNCTNGTIIVNTTSGWTYIDTPLNLIWDWDDINSTVNTDSTTIWVNTTGVDICVLNFNNTNYSMSQSGDRWTRALSGLPIGNYSNVTVRCNDTINNTNITSVSWIYINGSPAIATTLSYYCPPFVRVGENFVIWADYENSTGADVENATVNVSNATASYSLNYSAGESRYQQTFVSSNPMTWSINISANRSGYQSQNATCTIRIANYFNVTHVFWLLREYNENGTRNYHQLMNERYLNDFAYVVMRLEDIEVNTTYEYDCQPIEPPIQDLWEGIENWGWDFGGSGDLSLFEPYLGCTRYYFHAPLVNGQATLSLPYPGNYSMWLISGVMTFENQFAPPDIEHYLGIWVPFESMDYNSTNMTVNWAITSQELDYLAWLTDEIFLFLITLVPVIIIFLVWYLTGNLQLGITISAIFSLYLLLNRGGVL